MKTNYSIILVLPPRTRDFELKMLYGWHFLKSCFLFCWTVTFIKWQKALEKDRVTKKNHNNRADTPCRERSTGSSRTTPWIALEAHQLARSLWVAKLNCLGINDASQLWKGSNMKTTIHDNRGNFPARRAMVDRDGINSCSAVPFQNYRLVTKISRDKHRRPVSHGP